MLRARRLRQIRQARRKSLRVVAGLAGISSSHLHRIETGARPLDSLTLILALADALQVAPSELVTLPVPAPGNGGRRWNSRALLDRGSRTGVVESPVWLTWSVIRSGFVPRFALG